MRWLTLFSLYCLGGALATLSQGGLNFIFFSELVFFDHVAEASFGFGQMPEVSVGRYVNMTFDCQFNNNRQVCSEHMLIFWCLMLLGL